MEVQLLLSVSFCSSFGFISMTNQTCFSTEVHSYTCPRDYKPFVIQKHEPTDLCCSVDTCEHPKFRRDASCAECCQCNARPYWFPNKSSLPLLLVEYIYTNGKAVLLTAKSDTGQNIFIIEHNNNVLSSIPENICDFAGLVSITFVNDEITEIDKIGCLHDLDTLNLQYNRIEYVKNDTFRGLKKLRILQLAHNKIRTVDPNTLSDSTIALQFMDFSGNKLTDVDVTNIILDKPFCESDFSHNDISQISNHLGWTLDVSTTYGDGGMVLLGSNKFEGFIDFKSFGVSDLTKLGKIINFGFDIRHSKWTCDCKMEPYLGIAETLIKKLWKDYFNVTCYNPPELRNKSIPQLVKEGKLDLFICNVSHKHCPFNCKCINQPSQHRCIVNCSSQNLKSLPDFMPPDCDSYEIYLNSNKISEFDYRDYLNKTALLDLSNNYLSSLASVAISSLRNIRKLHLENNARLRNLPRAFQELHPCTLYMGSSSLDCDCDDVWIGEWLRNYGIEYKKCFIGNNQTDMLCHTVNGELKAYELTNDFLKCDGTSTVFRTASIILAVFFITLSTVCSAVFYFRYELYVLRKRLFSTNNVQYRKYDAYISCNETYVAADKWTRSVLLHELETSGYKVCYPSRDFSIGVFKLDELMDKMNMSRNIIVILSDNYFEESDEVLCEKEWNHAWQMYKTNTINHLIIINYDHVRSIETNDRRMKAFLRLQITMDYSNRRNSLISDVKELLGSPGTRYKYGMNNASIRFRKTKVAPEFESFNLNI